MAIPFLDTNVLLRHLLDDHPDHSPRASRAIVQIEQGELRVHISETVVFETVFTLSKTYGRTKTEIREALMSILDLPGFVLPGKTTFRKAFDLYVELNLPFADAYHAALADRLGTNQILSFDRDFDRVPGIERIEPQ